MRRAATIFLLLLTIAGVPAHAQLEATIAAAQLAEQKAYDAFMHIQVVQELMVLRQTYVASVAYYSQFQALNSGKGFLYNVGQQLQAAQNQETKQLSQQFMNSWNSKGIAPSALFTTIDQTIAANITYTGNEMANVIANRQAGVQMAQNANGLSPKDAANLAAKGQGMQVQALTQLHEDNLRLLQLLTLQLTAQTRAQEGQQTMIQNINQSVQTHYPGATLDTGGGQ
jgi:hypothetical protein